MVKHVHVQEMAKPHILFKKIFLCLEDLKKLIDLVIFGSLIYKIINGHS